MKTISTYERFHNYLLAWHDRDIECLVVRGNHGTGKSWAVEELLRGRPHHWFSAKTTAFQVYNQLHDAPHVPVVFDDVSTILSDSTFVDMLKNLCERGTSTIRWTSKTPLQEGRSMSFKCTAPVIILLNRLPKKNRDLSAVLDRCHNFTFEPTKSQMIAYMRSYFPADGELISLLEELAVLPSLRALMDARDWDRSPRFDLHFELLDEYGVPSGVKSLMDIMERFPAKEWQARYLEVVDRDVRTYRRHKLLAMQLLACRETQNECPDVRLQVPPLPTPPPSALSETKDPDSGRSDTGNSVPGFPDMSDRLRWWNPENN